MVWQKKLDEVRHRRRLIEEGGFPARIERQHAQGKLTVRERIAALADPGSFHEIGGINGLLGSEVYDGDKLVEVMPSGRVIGWFTLNGRKVLFFGDDCTVRWDAGNVDKLMREGPLGHGEAIALRWRLPYIRILDAPGASVRTYEEMARPEFVTTAQWITATARILPLMPVVSVVMGPSGGKPAIEACLCHFNIMVKGAGQVFPGGPPVVKAALGYDITKEELGGVQVLAYNGVIDNVTESEKDAFSIIRQFLSYLPQNVWEMPPRAEPADNPNRRDEELLSIIPQVPDKPYNPYEILNRVLDKDSLFEIAPLSGPSRITALARVSGYPVGVIATNPGYLDGAVDALACEKMVRFIRLCDTFHLPMVHLVDEPGYKTGLDSDKQGIVRAVARLVQAIYQTRVPWLSFIVRRVYAVGGSLAFRPNGIYKRYAWPSVIWESIHEKDGRLPIYRTADRFGVEDIIDPRDTRPLLCDFIESSQDMLRTQLGPRNGPSYWP